MLDEDLKIRMEAFMWWRAEQKPRNFFFFFFLPLSGAELRLFQQFHKERVGMGLRGGGQCRGWCNRPLLICFGLMDLEFHHPSAHVLRLSCRCSVRRFSGRLPSSETWNEKCSRPSGAVGHQSKRQLVITDGSGENNNVAIGRRAWYRPLNLPIVIADRNSQSYY